MTRCAVRLSVPRSGTLTHLVAAALVAGRGAEPALRWS